MGILNAKDFEFEFEKRDERLRDIERVIRESEYSDEEKEWFRIRCTFDPNPIRGWLEFHDSCFFCGEQLVIPCIYWHGSPRSRELESSDRCQIWLHPLCVVNFAEKLLDDFQKLRGMKKT